MVIAPNGFIFKCWNEIAAKAHEAVGHVFKKQKNLYRYNFQKWIAYNIFENPECIKCKLLPICMGGCVYLNLKSKKQNNTCTTFKYNLINMMKMYYTVTKRLKKKTCKSTRQKKKKQKN